MKPAPFTLLRPTTLQEAAAMLAEFSDEGGLVLAGGQSLVPMMALRIAYPSHLVDINGIAGLDRLEREGEKLVIGATVRHARFHRPVEPGCLGRLLTAVSHNIAHYPIRMRGTFCGSLAHADPASEWCLVAATLDAELRLVSVAGERTMAPSDYLTGAMTTAREGNEILAEVRLPILPEGSSFGFYEFNRRAGDFALGMALVTFQLRGGVMHDVRVGIGGIEERPRRVSAAEAALEGQPAEAAAFKAAADATTKDVSPMEDFNTPAQYRRELSGTVVRRALEKAMTNLTAKH